MEKQKKKRKLKAPNSYVEGSLPECDLIFADRNNSINKKVVYGKSGKVYQNRG